MMPNRTVYYDDQLERGDGATITMQSNRHPSAYSIATMRMTSSRARTAALAAFGLLVITVTASLHYSGGAFATNSVNGAVAATVTATEQLSVGTAVAGPDAPHGFPSDGTWHASCHMSVVLPSTPCPEAMAEALKLIETNVDTGTDYRGTMAVYDKGSDWIWSTRLTYDKKYTDDQLFEFGPVDSSASAASSLSLSLSSQSCLISMRSRSESRSVIDYGVNYCNMWNVVSKISGFGEAEPPVVSECYSRNIPSDPVATCARY